jgi:hypothetical protein
MHWARSQSSVNVALGAVMANVHDNLRSARERAVTAEEQAALDFALESLRAISTPLCVRSISSVECASGLMLMMQPSSSARRCHRQSRSRRHGLPLISTATPYSAHAFNMRSMSTSYPGLRSNCLPVMWPKMVVYGVATARRIRSVWVFRSSLNRLWTLATTKSKRSRTSSG